MKKKPLISVIMGVYNVGSYENFAYAINSILNQTYENFELIICDDGSTDKTSEYVKVFKNEDKRIILIKNDKNRGLAYTLNHCLEYAKGKYIARMDADDFSHQDRFEKQIDFLENNKEFSLVGCNANLFDSNGIWGKRKMPKVIKKEDFLFNSPIIHPAIMVKREALSAISNYLDIERTLRCEDYDLFMRLYANGCKMYNMQEYLFDYREDKNCYSRRKYKFRIYNAQTRLYGYKLLKLLPKGYIYVLKPLVVGIIPTGILKKMRKEYI